MQVNKYILVVLLFFSVLNLCAQQDSLEFPTPFQLNLKDDVLNLKPQRAFGSTSSVLLDVEEDNFTTPAAVSVLTREEIEKSGVQSLAEAFRLIPGCMVRERSKGNFDIAISNAVYLVKGDEQFANLDGDDLVILVNGVTILQRTGNNIWWESLPNIASIDQIEVMSGPSVAIYGVSSSGGLINIITRKMSLDKLKIVADAGVDQNQDHYLSTYAESAFSENLKMNLIFDYRFISRPNTDYYVLSEQRYLPSDSLLYFQAEVEKRNPSDKLSVNAISVKSLLEYKNQRDLTINLLLEHQNSQAQTAIINNEQLFMNERLNQTSSGTFSLRYKRMRFSTKASFGERNYFVGNDGYYYLNSTAQSKIDFPFKYKKIEIHTGIFHNGSAIKSAIPKEKLTQFTPYIDVNFNSYGAYTILDYKPISKIRALLNLSFDYFPEIDRSIFAYTGLLGYSASKKLFFRMSAGRSYTSPTIETSLESQLFLGTVNFNKAITPAQVDNIEIGMRAKFLTFFETELNIFARRYSSFQEQDLDLQRGLYKFNNNDIELKNYGITANFKFRFEKLHVRPFLTISGSSLNDAESNDEPYPQIYGGLSINYATYYNRLNFNFLLYVNEAYDLNYRGIRFEIDRTIVPYFKVNYRLKNQSSIYFTAKNFMQNTEHIEYPFADHLQSQFLIGLHFNFITK